MNDSIAVVGLVHMGLGVPKRLISAGFSVRVSNRTRERASLVHSAVVCDSPADAARNATLVLSSVANDDAVLDVTLGSRGILSALGEGGDSRGCEHGVTHRD